jgi:acyl carrier protein
MTNEEWNAAVASKVPSSLNLIDVLGRHTLDFFVLLSSNVGVTGNPEQANYAAANTFQDALARQLASEGVNAVCLDLPVIRDVGFVAEKPELFDFMRSMGWAWIEQDEFHAVLDYYCQAPKSPRPVLHSQLIPRLWLPQETAAEGYATLPWPEDPLFNHLRLSTSESASQDTTADQEVNHASLLASATSFDVAEKIVLEALLLKISRVLSVDVANLDASRPLHAFGVDSLVAVELRSWLAKELKAEVSVFDMTNKPSIQLLAKAATERSKLTEVKAE